MSRPPPRDDDPDRHPAWSGFAWAIAGVAFTTLFASPWRPTLESANIVMLYLLVVVVVACSVAGRRPVTVCGVAAFDFLCPAIFFCGVRCQYLLTFAVMLATGLAIAHLTARLRRQAWRTQRDGSQPSFTSWRARYPAPISDEPFRVQLAPSIDFAVRPAGRTGGAGGCGTRRLWPGPPTWRARSYRDRRPRALRWSRPATCFATANGTDADPWRSAGGAPAQRPGYRDSSASS
jgi:hypothetical protein